ncbi:hypothetical protein EB835_19145 [Brevibacterium sp. S22]|nr:hypothetical protein EB835_19145 [Brevibacterium sp. S22]
MPSTSSTNFLAVILTAASPLTEFDLGWLLEAVGVTRRTPGRTLPTAGGDSAGARGDSIDACGDSVDACGDSVDGRKG